MEQLAIFGGEKVKKTPFGTGKRFGEEELNELREALEQNTLFYYFGTKVKTFNKKFAQMYQTEFCVATSSGTAAIHAAYGAIGLSIGDEVIVPPITDMGSIIGILYQNAIPVFADLDPYSYNMDPNSIKEKITKKTKAILVVHLAGNPADMDPIMEIAKEYHLKVIEDCAQSFLAYYKGRLVGTIGDIGCFSINDFKHISAGDGGMLIMNDEKMYEKAVAFTDKNYNRLSKNLSDIRNINLIAHNYRMNELTGAVGIAQLDKLNFICSKRHAYGEQITEGIKNLPGICPPKILKDCKSSYWFYMFRVNELELQGGIVEFSQALAAEGIPNSVGYIKNCVYEYNLFQNRTAYEGSHFPFDLSNITYYKGLCPVAEEILKSVIQIQLNEFYTQTDIDEIISAIRKVHLYYQKK